MLSLHSTLCKCFRYAGSTLELLIGLSSVTIPALAVAWVSSLKVLCVLVKDLNIPTCAKRITQMSTVTTLLPLRFKTSLTAADWLGS